MLDYPYSSEKMCFEYLNLFKKLTKESPYEISKDSDNSINRNVIEVYLQLQQILNYLNIYKFKIK